MSQSQTSTHKGLSHNFPENIEEVAEYYDNWSQNYDRTLVEWRYEAPERTASMLIAEIPQKSVILDAGCGTGMSGRALHFAGFETIDGIDVSASSLKVAQTAGVYRSLNRVNMKDFPFPIPDDQYDGLACVGVLAYLPDTRGTLQEFIRVVKPKGRILFTQRNDLFAERDYQSALKNLSNDGLIDDVHVSEPSLYLPDNEEFGDKLLVHYVSFRVV